jgi:DNA-binding transcriptional ArsR family regulator
MRRLTYVQQAQLFGALAHPVRLGILDILAEGEACVCHLSTALHQRQAYMSQQLARLKEAGLIVDTRDGLFVYYHLADKGMVQVLHDARHMLAGMTGTKYVPQPTPSLGSSACSCPRCQTARIVPHGQVAAVVTTG